MDQDNHNEAKPIEVRTVLSTYRYNWGRIEDVVTEDWEVVRRIITKEGVYYQLSD